MRVFIVTPPYGHNYSTRYDRTFQLMSMYSIEEKIKEEDKEHINNIYEMLDEMTEVVDGGFPGEWRELEIIDNEIKIKEQS